METWKEVQGTNGLLSVSNYGRVKGRRKVLKAQLDHKGYERIRFTVDRVKMSARVHRLVAEAFISNPENKPQVNHIDGNKSNNHYSNLEWVTNKENAHHAIKNGLFNNTFDAVKIANEAQKKPVVAISKDGTSRIEFDSVRAAEKHFGTRHISSVLSGKREHTKDHKFVYAEKGVI
jgi:hypothetical protein